MKKLKVSPHMVKMIRLIERDKSLGFRMKYDLVVNLVLLFFFFFFWSNDYKGHKEESMPKRLRMLMVVELDM